MSRWNPKNEELLRAQVKSQRRHRWDIDKDIDWKTPIDPQKPLLPLDRDALLFPGVSAEQRLALSQLMGLVLNSTIGEMEEAILKLRDVAWEQWMRRHPVNPEMWELGDLFFEEEAKHSATFSRYVERFCEDTGVPREALDRLLPKAFGSYFMRATLANARAGGFVFWWVVAAVEEVSVEIFRHLKAHEKGIEPLFYSIHRRHLEEEARHRNYAFLMLELVHRSPTGILGKLARKTELLKAQALTTAWMVAELAKVFEAERLRHVHPFFETVASALPRLRELGWAERLKRLFVSAPFISLVLNQKHHRLARKAAEDQRVWSFPFPEPRLSPVYIPDLPRKKGKAA